MYYNEAFLRERWTDYLNKTGMTETQVDPDTFIRWAFEKLIEWREPRYKAIADNWGVTIPAQAIENVQTPKAFLDLVEGAAR